MASVVSIPRDLTSFIGRTRDLKAIADLFANGTPLVSLIGPPGIGKTRVATTVGRRNRAGSTFFCDMRNASTVDGLCTSLARSLEIRITHGEDSAASVGDLGRALAARGSCLVILDNFEQLVEVGATPLHAWLCSAPNARFLVTSRRVLRIEGEHVHELEALSLPAHEEDWESESMRLFYERARSLEPGFDRDSPQARHVAPLVRHLEGIPLAIELAAAQIHRTGPGELLRGLGGSPLELVDPVRNRRGRYETLRAAIEASWQRLDPRERAALTQLTVFRGGFTLQAARAALGETGETSETARQVSLVAEVVAALREASLLRVAATDPLRWDMYEAIREFVTGHFRERDTAAHARHAQYYLEWGERWARDTCGVRSLEARQVLTSETENLRAAFDWILINDGPPEEALRLALVLHEAVGACLPAATAEILTRALMRDGTAARLNATGLTKTRTRALLGRSEAHRRAGNLEQAQADLDEASELAREDRRLGTEIDSQVGWLCLERGKPLEARAALERALGSAQALGADHLEGQVRASLAWVLAEAFRDPEAFEHWDEAASLLRRSGDFLAETMTRVNCAAYRVSLFHEDRTEELRAHLSRARQFQDPWTEAMALLALGWFEQEEGDFEQAQQVYERARNVAAGSGIRYIEGCAIMILGTVLDEAAQYHEAKLRLEEATELFGTLNAPRMAGLCQVFMSGLLAREGNVEQARGLLRRSEQRLGRDGGSTFQALPLVQRGQIKLAESRRAWTEGDTARAKALRQEASEHLEVEAMLRTEGVCPERPLFVRLCIEMRFTLRMLERELTARHDDRPLLQVWPDGSAFRFGNQPAVRLPEGPVIRRALTVFAEQRTESPGVPLSRETLLRRCWPSERILPASAQYRVRDIVKRLRRVGLADVLLRTEHGYLFDPSVPLRVSGASRRVSAEPTNSAT